MKKILLSILFLGIFVSAFAQLEQQAYDKIDELNDLIAVAEQFGIDTYKEKMTVRTASIFLNFAKWDENHVVENTTMFDMVQIYRDSAATMANELPDFERQEVILMLEDAIDFLQKLIDGEYTRKPIPQVNWATTTHDDDQLTFNDRPIFLQDYTWKPGIFNLQEYHGQLDGFFISPNHVTDENGTINSNIIADLNTKPSNTMGFVFIANQNLPDWAKAKYGSNFELRTQNTFIDYDIDNPGAKVMMGHLLDGTVSKMRDKKYTELGYMLCNEPHFFTSQGAWARGPVSNYTIDRFKNWLEEKHGNITTLNAVWGTTYTDFSDVSITIPMSTGLQGSAKWYDWCLFNMYRGTDWFGFLKQKIKENDPNAKTHLKIMPNLWVENPKDHGIDLEALTEMSEIIGNDAGAWNNWMGNGTQWWETDYTFYWVEMTMSYDFLKSVSPNKIVFNSESHYLSKNRSRDLYQSPKYARATYWLAHVFGLNADQTWYWAREADGSIRHNAGVGYAGSNNQQPRIVNEVEATVMDLNANAEEIMAMQRQEKPIRLFYTKTSAINKSNHMDDVRDLYESLFFEGVSLGFATKNIIEKQDNNNWEVIVIYDTEFITQAEMDALQAYLNDGGTIIKDNISLTKNEYGQAIGGLTQGNGTLKVVSSLVEIKNEAMSIITTKDLLPNFTITETNGNNNKKGCYWKAVTNEAGNDVITIVNVGKSTATLNVQLKNNSENLVYKNLFNGTVLPETMTLEPYDVVFFETVTAESLVEEPIVNILYPNPTKGYFRVQFEEQQPTVEMSVFDTTGRIIMQKTYTEVRQITEKIEEQPAGNYVIRLKIGEKVQSFVLVKQ